MESVRSLNSSPASSREPTPAPVEDAVMEAAPAPAVDAAEHSRVAAPATTDSAISSQTSLLALASAALSAMDTPVPALAPGITPLEELLKHPIEFIPYTGDSALSKFEQKYKPVNPPNSPQYESDTTAISTVSTASATSLASTSVSSTSTRVEHADTLVQAQAPKQSAPAPSINDRPLLMTWRQAMPSPPCGLVNFTNSCFMNAVLQGLMWCAPFAQALLSEPAYNNKCPHPQPPRRAPQGRGKGREDDFYCTLCQTAALTRRFHSPARKAFRLKPYELFDGLARIMPLDDYEVGWQHDAHEFLVFLRDRLSSAAFSLFPKPAPVKDGETPPPKPLTFIQKLFGFKTRQRIKCHRCGYCSDTINTEEDLGLEIQGVNDIKDAIRQQFSRVEILKGADSYDCEKCKTKVPAEKSCALIGTPPVLTVYLKRFETNNGRKLQHLVQYPSVLDLTPYLAKDKDAPQPTSTRYRLTAVVCHEGSAAHSGHYTAIVQTSSTPGASSWVLADDDYVQNVRGPMSQRNAYMLLYIRDSSLGKSPGLQKVLKPAQPVAHDAAANAQPGGAHVTNKNGKRAVVDDEDVEEGRDTSPKRPRTEGPEHPVPMFRPRMVKLLASPGKTDKDDAPRSPQAPQSTQPIGSKGIPDAVDVLEKLRGEKAAEPQNPGKDAERNGNGKRSSDDEDAGAPVKRQRRDSIIRSPELTPTAVKDNVPPMSPIASTTPTFAGLPARLSTAVPSSPSTPGRKRRADEAFDAPPKTAATAPAGQMTSSPRTPVASTSTSGKKSKPAPANENDFDFDALLDEPKHKKPKKDTKYKTTYGSRPSYGGKNPYNSSVVLGSGFGGARSRMIL
ncbi:cysteine proteinase [Calocera viscosa TUFC12733]|uniref:ubiquitinyl hydrolase 1 n=1 Tax=Calocera viscosa (strain TUFC12733) TaxID=1330018 RepID=A0A167NUR8_CALVF|nr:cysteine proteinase [Calocera viscosa TUFC12733]